MGAHSRRKSETGGPCGRDLGGDDLVITELTDREATEIARRMRDLERLGDWLDERAAEFFARPDAAGMDYVLVWSIDEEPRFFRSICEMDRFSDTELTPDQREVAVYKYRRASEQLKLL